MRTKVYDALSSRTDYVTPNYQYYTITFNHECDDDYFTLSGIGQ